MKERGRGGGGERERGGGGGERDMEGGGKRYEWGMEGEMNRRRERERGREIIYSIHLYRLHFIFLHHYSTWPQTTL